MTTDPLVASIRESYGRCVYTHKTHEKDRERCSALANAVKWANIVLNGLTSGGIVTAALIGSTGYAWAAAVLATLTLGFALVQLSFDPASDAVRHRATAKELLVIRDAYINLIADAKSGLEDAELRARRDDLDSELHTIYEHAPDTSSRAYRKAQEALQLKEELTFSSEELDLLLPQALREGP